jgi:hypothetical protein
MALARAVIPAKGISGSGSGSNHAGSVSMLPAISPPYRPVSIFEERFSEDNALLSEGVPGWDIR